jgi:hypothetical protein
MMFFCEVQTYGHKWNSAGCNSGIIRGCLRHRLLIVLKLDYKARNFLADIKISAGEIIFF